MVMAIVPHATYSYNIFSWVLIFLCSASRLLGEIRQQPTTAAVICPPLSTTHERTQIDDSYKYPVARFPSEGYTMFFCGNASISTYISIIPISSLSPNYFSLSSSARNRHLARGAASHNG